MRKNIFLKSAAIIILAAALIASVSACSTALTTDEALAIISYKDTDARPENVSVTITKEEVLIYSYENGREVNPFDVDVGEFAPDGAAEGYAFVSSDFSNIKIEEDGDMYTFSGTLSSTSKALGIKDGAKDASVTAVINGESRTLVSITIVYTSGNGNKVEIKAAA